MKVDLARQCDQIVRLGHMNEAQATMIQSIVDGTPGEVVVISASGHNGRVEDGTDASGNMYINTNGHSGA